VLLDRAVLLRVAPGDTIPPEAEGEFRLMAEAWNTIQRVYVDRDALVAQNLAYGAINGMVDALGDTGHSRFMSPEMVQEQRKLTEGEFEGIGAEVQMRDGQVVIVTPMDGSPALEAGLRPGDIILEVDGASVAGLSLVEVVAQIVGPAGTSVSLTLLDPDTGTTRQVAIVRARITLESVTWQRLPGTGIAHIRITRFSNGAGERLGDVLAQIQQQELDGVILDLRNNPGGLLGEAVTVASHFLQVGNVLLVRNAQGEVTPVPVEPGGWAPQLPLVVLINGGSASASEIVAGAIQDAGRGTLVGETTFGTGTVLSQFPLSDGSALLLAIQEWLTPDGRQIWHEGIAPDIAVPMSVDVVLLRPLAEQAMTADELHSSEDVQLLRALDVLGHSVGQ